MVLLAEVQRRFIFVAKELEEWVVKLDRQILVLDEVGVAFKVVIVRAFFIEEEFVGLGVDASFELSFTIINLIDDVASIFY